jgi:hypothetical protein
MVVLLCFRLESATKETTRIAVYKIQSEILSGAFAGALTDHIETRLIALPLYRVIARTNIDILVSEDHLMQSGISIDDLQRKGGGGMLSAVDELCIGSVSRIGKQYTITLKILDARTGRIRAAVQRVHDGPMEELLGIAGAMVEELCGYVPECIGTTSVTPEKNENQ